MGKNFGRIGNVTNQYDGDKETAVFRVQVVFHYALSRRLMLTLIQLTFRGHLLNEVFAVVEKTKKKNG